MILSVQFDREPRHGENSDETSRLIAEAMENLESESWMERAEGFLSPGVNAWFCWAEQPHITDNRVADNYLRVAINKVDWERGSYLVRRR